MPRLHCFTLTEKTIKSDTLPYCTDYPHVPAALDGSLAAIPNFVSRQAAPPPILAAESSLFAPSPILDSRASSHHQDTSLLYSKALYNPESMADPYRPNYYEQDTTYRHHSYKPGDYTPQVSRSYLDTMSLFIYFKPIFAQDSRLTNTNITSLRSSSPNLALKALPHPASTRP